jgi:predicted alpha/beta superfamily hydrolase
MVLALLSAQNNVYSAAGDALLRIHYPAAGHSVTVRGSAGGLSWTVGQPTAAASKSGDTFTYTLVGLTAPAEWKPLLDDATWSRGPNYHIAPGQTVDVWPHFTTISGRVVTLISAFHSTVLGNDRAIYAYLPPSYGENTDATYPVVYMQDGQNLWAALPQIAFAGTWNVDTAFDAAAEMGSCSAGGVVGWGAQPLGGTPATCTGDGDCPSGECRTFPEAIVIGVANTPNRIYEYTPTTDPNEPFPGGGADSYVQMLTDELKPTIDAMLRTQPGAGSTAIAGSSLGGLVSAYAALRRPDVFGLVAALSPSTWWNNDVIVSDVAGTLPAPNRPQIVYVDCGQGTAAGTLPDDQVDTDRLAAQYLALGYVNGVNFRYVVQPGASHDETHWAERFPGAMQFLLGGPPNTPPVAKCPFITAPPSQVVVADPATCGATVSKIGPASAGDNCSSYSIAYALTGATTGTGINDASGTAFNQGVTTVTYTITDAAGSNASCSLTVTVTNPNPVVTLTGPTNSTPFAVNTPVTFTATFTDDNGGTHSGTWMFNKISQTATIVEPTPGTPASADGSPGSPPLPGSASATRTFTAAGVYSVTLTVNDNCGVAGTASQIGGTNLLVTVVLLNNPPVARCTNVTVSAGANCMADASIDNGSFDPDVGDTITLTQTPPGPYPLGNTIVTLTVTDNHGASSTCASTVTVLDTTPPSITCPANISMGCALDRLVVVTYPAPTVSDTCDPHPTVACTPASGTASFPIGVTTVVCQAVDAAGNPNSCSFTVTRASLGFTGFLSPIGGEVALDTGGSFGTPVRAFKLGSTIPIKFSANCGGTPVSAGVHTLQATKYSSAVDSALAIDATPTGAATTGNQFQLTDATTGEWHFNLDTKPLSVGTWKLTATLSDGSIHEAWIGIK